MLVTYITSKRKLTSHHMVLHQPKYQHHHHHHGMIQQHLLADSSLPSRAATRKMKWEPHPNQLTHKCDLYEDKLLEVEQCHTQAPTQSHHEDKGAPSNKQEMHDSFVSTLAILHHDYQELFLQQVNDDKPWCPKETTEEHERRVSKPPKTTTARMIDVE